MSKIKKPKEGRPYNVLFVELGPQIVYPIDGHLIGLPGYEEGFVNLIGAISHNYKGCMGINAFHKTAIPYEGLKNVSDFDRIDSHLTEK